MTTATRLQLQATVDAIAAHAYIAPPRVRLWRHRNARYNALTHTIAVSQTLALTLDANQRYTLLAHEVGHAQRRATMLKRVGSYFWPPALALVVGVMTDRLGRSMQHLIETIAALEARGVGFRSLTESIDTTTPGGRLILRVGRDSCKKQLKVS
ncbi:hypothetical protein E1J23_20445 [Xanthomonas gardneri]|uniref:Resolvase/invertase-type recombinase catalytic domain-containing protein n=1 Tax=Xanthomonas hortorum pv. vitians TaxID=83224 RepID=A0A6V7FM99_9XANT|nr:hypothetical protein BI317_25720 [Xanthomonas hortorum pv. gardneri]NMI33190.1 hypothetical protein [Xanthomonas hortorum pv. vitians]NMI49732.1 hypothetical protein [Xanthomonas hortorum pv. gardneri]CAD0364864.1 hypothetical protein CFBP498_50520 [Xanthomonas hortorum pv. vitians]CAD0364865.1 hypothetical protein CFBP498_50520 [Xanthomonas hortorum pv. vitians]